MSTPKVTSAKYKLDWRDFLKGLLVAMLTAFMATGGQMLETWVSTADFTFSKVDLILSLKAALSAGIAYLIKNWLTPQQVVKTVQAIGLLLCLTFVTGCNFTRDVLAHNKVEVVRTPKTPEDTISVVWKFWGAQDLVKQYFPGNSKLAVFLRESTKHCSVNIVRVPKNPNDTIAVKLTCDSSLTTFKGWLPKKK